MTATPSVRFVLAALMAVSSLSSTSAEDRVYRDKNGYFEFTPPAGWVLKEFDDPRSKVSFSVPAPVAGQSRAAITLLAHPITGDINVKAEAENRMARLRQMGAADAKTTTVPFAGGTAERVEGQMARQNTALRAFIFVNQGRSYVVQFAATPQDFDTYWPAAEASLKTFVCLAPAGVQVTSTADTARIEQEKIRVWITALKEPDLGIDAFASLKAIGQPAIPQLEEIQKTGTSLQKQRAAELLKLVR
jgi:hypothetical protein